MTARDYNQREILAGRLLPGQVEFLASRSAPKRDQGAEGTQSPQEASDSPARLEAGCRAFQASAGLLVDGKAGPKTRRAVDQAQAGLHQAAGPVMKSFPVKIPRNFMPRRIVDRKGIRCPGQDAPFKPKSGGGMKAPRGPSRTPHNAWDIMCAVGALVCAVDDGQVMTTWRYDGRNIPGVAKTPKGGWIVRIQHSWGTSYYAHLDEEPLVRAGQRIKAGEHLGFAGDSGNATGGCPHLHLGFQDTQGRPLDPVALLKSLYESEGWRLG